MSSKKARKSKLEDSDSDSGPDDVSNIFCSLLNHETKS